VNTPDEQHDGVLILAATPIGNLGDLSTRLVEALRTADVIAAEDPDHTWKLLAHLNIPKDGRMREIHQHNERDAANAVVRDIEAGKTVLYVTDAGMPGISDPGAVLVRAAIDAGLRVEALPGPSAFVQALVLSGLSTARFRFEGFLPRKGPERRARLAAINASDDTVVLYESPRRVQATLNDLLAACGPDRAAAVARELTKRFETIERGPLKDLAEHEFIEKGEYAIVVAGAPTTIGEVDDETIRAALNDAIRAGKSARDASAEVAADLGVAKRRVYELAIRPVT
jgi:16S rRNA (cytidine1402-2'-O)-methyltransferase